LSCLRFDESRWETWPKGRKRVYGTKSNFPVIYITQLIYLKPGREHAFHEFEKLAIPLISRYNGDLLLRLRPAETEIVENNISAPYEVHLVSFPADKDFENFMNDEERKRFLHLKEDSIESSILIKGIRL
jgi:hypothetical protein